MKLFATSLKQKTMFDFTCRLSRGYRGHDIPICTNPGTHEVDQLDQGGELRQW